MKKGFVCFLLALAFNLTACADKKEVITFAQLPQNAQELISANFDAAAVSYITKERDFLSDEYEVRFNNGAEIEFEQDGTLKKVDCKGVAVPEAILPQEVLTYVKTNFPSASVTEWGKDDANYKAELNNGLELKFDRSYRFLRLDD